MRIFSALLALLFIVEFQAVAQQVSIVDTIAARYQLPSADCAAFPATARLPWFLDDSILHATRFTPSKHQIVRTEKALLKVDLAHINNQLASSYYVKYSAIITQQLPLYQRQYFGYYNSQGHPCLYINLFILQLEEPPGYVPYWLRTIVKMHDGGASFWSIFYDLKTRRFYNFSHNSEG